MRYSKTDESLVFDMLTEKGEDWCAYYGPDGRERYKEALESSITYVVYNQEDIAGYVRCREDFGFGVYIYDLLVRKSCRGKKIGKSLMERIYKEYPNENIYVMSDVDAYYEKLGYRKEGSIFAVKL